MLGDSHACMWAGVIDEIASDRKLTVSFYSAAGVSPFETLHGDPSKGFSSVQMKAFNQAKMKRLEAWKPVVILTARWSSVVQQERVRELIEKIGSTGSRICLIEQPPEIAVGDRNALQYLVHEGVGLKEGEAQSFKKANIHKVSAGIQLIHSIAQDYDYCSVIEVNDLYSTNEEYAWVLDGTEPLYYDDDHLSQQGALRAKALIEDAILTEVNQLRAASAISRN